jgi:hypothetical protein
MKCQLQDSKHQFWPKSLERCSTNKFQSKTSQPVVLVLCLLARLYFLDKDQNQINNGDLSMYKRFFRMLN